MAIVEHFCILPPRRLARPTTALISRIEMVAGKWRKGAS